ncbi:MAG: terminase [Pseudanabaena sp. M085S1SP2A07QC]|nr:terminase [Pseudanabaena sp. M090S1SP2A07QC]MCA6508747.1 terminase [Pseudanabaena sp. M109S1SP2A07QC]MCA6579481.1 terminase [Pseudanabaena sp. M085S1SP2A07QC]
MGIQQRVDRKLREIDDLFEDDDIELEPILWQPFKGKPQEFAYYSPAQDLLYGGEPGGGKSDLIAGLALTAHKRSLILRREASQLNEIVSRIEDQLCGGNYRFHGKTHILKYGDRWVEKGGCKLLKDRVRYKGRPHDLKAFDELSEFPKEVYDYVKIWNRTSDSNQRCRTVATTNPPDTQEGQWIIQYWSPWLDKRHPNPAQSGEIRWYLGDTEVDEGTPDARSRTFIYSSITDNAVLMATGYQSTLNALPEELRRTMMEGFVSGMQDTPYQVIPTQWVQDAINRGKLLEQKSLLEPIDAIACDPSRGGKDACAIATRRGYNIQTKEYPAIKSQDGLQVVQYIIEARQGQNPITMIDVIGIGSSPYDIAKLQGLEPIAMNASEKSYKRDRSGKLSFANKRAEWWWKFREALDPNYNSQITLPDDPRIIAELTAPLWSLTMRGILIESKEEIKKRLGRSTNLADAIVMVSDVPSLYTSSFI